jgi:SAM-dependent methyltransferase
MLNPTAGLAVIACLRKHNIDAAFVRSLTEGADDLRAPLLPTREALHSDHPRAVAVRLFFCRIPVPEAAEVLGNAFSDLLANDTFPFHLRIVRGLYLFSDYLGDGDPDAVMGAGETTAILYQAAKPTLPVGRVLDLGSGAGTLALMLAKDATEVLATDVNPRAVALGAFNAAINGIRNVEFRVSDLFTALPGERFDLIVSQPPYYPGAGLTFLHGGARGDELATRIVESIPDHLHPQARGVVFTSWPDTSHLPVPAAYQILDLSTSRREPNGARQSLRILQHTGEQQGWSAHFTVPADCWGHVHSWRIDEIIAAETLARAPDRELLAAHLKMPRGAVRFQEGSQLFLQAPPEALFRFAPIDENTWDLLSAIESGVPANRLDEVRAALRRGLLIINKCPT